jgi:hypothetical protein
LNFGSAAADTTWPDSNCSTTQLSLPFPFAYFSGTFTYACLCNGAIQFNCTNANVIAGVKELVLSTQMFGSVFYRSVADAATLATISGWINTANLSVWEEPLGLGSFGYVATNAFVVTWNHVNVNYTAGADASFQIILVTDAFDQSYYVQIFGAITGYTGSYYSKNGNVVKSFSGTATGSNVNKTGFYIYKVHNTSKS